MNLLLSMGVNLKKKKEEEEEEKKDIQSFIKTTCAPAFTAAIAST